MSNQTKYRPSNGTEGDSFRAAFCDRCQRAGTDEPCHILIDTMIHDIDDPEYPSEWVQDDDGAECTAFEPELDQ